VFNKKKTTTTSLAQAKLQLLNKARLVWVAPTMGDYSRAMAWCYEDRPIPAPRDLQTLAKAVKTAFPTNQVPGEIAATLIRLEGYAKAAEGDTEFLISQMDAHFGAVP
jgi:hypothetical protein